MTNREVALLAFKVLALWLMANAAIAVAGIPYYWTEPWEEVRRAAVAFTLLPVLVSIGIGLPLWFSADWFAARIFPGASAPARPDRLRSEPLFALALSILGVFFVADALPQILSGVVLFVRSSRTTPGFLGGEIANQQHLWNEAAKEHLTTALARLSIGLLMLVGPGSLSAALARVKKELRSDLTVENTEGEEGGAAPEGGTGEAQGDHGK